jgi:hypothetical protein
MMLGTPLSVQKSLSGLASQRIVLQQSVMGRALFHYRHSRESGNPVVPDISWIPAFAGMTLDDGPFTY